jgi:uncharacterized membrane protein YedE/YeeE
LEDLTGIIVVSSLMLASVLGFVAHRASVCTVRAVAEVVSVGQGYMFLSFFKTVLWVMAITMPLMWWWPDAHGANKTWAISTPALMGGLLFGMGAALNKGCAFSTLSRLGDGNLAMLVTLAGFCAGIYTHARLSDAYPLPHGTLLETAYTTPTIWTAALLGALWVWVIWETARLWRTRRGRAPWWVLARSDRYRLSTAAAVIGISNAFLYALHGTWAYTGTISQEVRHVATGDAGSSVIQWGLFAALLLGMGWSSWRRHSFRLVWRPSLSWAMSFPAGLLMGLGAALVPGSNDVLILHAIPGLSPHALPAYVGMLTGIALPLVLMRVTQGTVMRVDCSGDVCQDGRGRDPVDRARTVSGVAK